MSSLILRDLLKHKIRKQILKQNKSLNHKAFVKSMEWGAKIPFLMKYHKKKLIFLLLLSVLTWHYSLHKSVYHWLIGTRPPHKILLGMIVDLPVIQPTVTQLDIRKISLSQQTIDVLTKLHYQTDKYLYFGLGRRYLFQVYTQIEMLQTEQQQKMFYQKSQFFKKRNQLAAGVGLVEHLTIFEQALKKKREKNGEVTQEMFLNDFIKKFIQVAPQVMKWQREFNESRQKEYIKNAPGLSDAKREVVSEILKQNPEITMKQMQQRLNVMGLRGLNTSDKFYFHRSKQVWWGMREMLIRKKLSHPTIHMNLTEKNNLERELQTIAQAKQQLAVLKQNDLKEYEKMYEKQLL